jgi:hypothetical protein
MAIEDEVLRALEQQEAIRQGGVQPFADGADEFDQSIPSDDTNFLEDAAFSILNTIASLRGEGRELFTGDPEATPGTVGALGVGGLAADTLSKIGAATGIPSIIEDFQTGAGRLGDIISSGGRSGPAISGEAPTDPNLPVERAPNLADFEARRQVADAEAQANELTQILEALKVAPSRADGTKAQDVFVARGDSVIGETAGGGELANISRTAPGTSARQTINLGGAPSPKVLQEAGIPENQAKSLSSLLSTVKNREQRDQLQTLLVQSLIPKRKKSDLRKDLISIIKGKDRRGAAVATKALLALNQGPEGVAIAQKAIEDFTSLDNE